MAEELGAPAVRALEDGVRRAGRTEALSLTATYQFGSDELASAGLGDRALRVWLHENMHAYQALATPYGYLIHCLRSFQAGRVMRVLRELGEAGVDPAPPIVSQAARLPRGVRERVAPDVRAWLLAETVILYLEGDVDRFFTLALSPAFRGRSFASLFQELEHDGMSPFFTGGGHTLVEQIERHAPVEDTDLEGLVFAFKAFDVPGQGDTLSVLESGAKIIEWWRAWPADIDALSASLSEGARNTVDGNVPYRGWIRHAIPRLRAPDARSFALTYSALTDLALHAPLLPHHAQLRHPGTHAGDLNPLWRLVSAMDAVAERRIPPIVDLHADYLGFVDAVCDARSWPTPAALSVATVDRFPPPGAAFDPATLLHQLSAAYRDDDPVAFLDMDVWWTDSREAHEFCAIFTHPISQFGDEEPILFGRPDIAYALVTNFVVNRYLTTLMTSTRRPLPAVDLPYLASDEELEGYRIQAESVVRANTGLADPRLRLVSRRGGADHA